MKRMRKQVKKNKVKQSVSKWVDYFKLGIAILSSIFGKIPSQVPVFTSNSKVETICRTKNYEETHIKMTVRSSGFDVEYQRKKNVEY